MYSNSIFSNRKLILQIYFQKIGISIQFDCTQMIFIRKYLFKNDFIFDLWNKKLFNLLKSKKKKKVAMVSALACMVTH